MRKLELVVTALAVSTMFYVNQSSAQSIEKFSIRKTIIQSYPDVVLKKGIDFDKNGIIEGDEELPDENENGKFDEEDYWIFYQNNKDIISRKVTQKVEGVKDLAKSGIEGTCYGYTSCIVTCLRVLGAMKDKSNIPIFLRELGSYDGEVRQAAADALGNTGDKSVNGMLLEVAKNDERPKTRAAAVKALGKTSTNADKDIITEVRMILSDDDYSVVKYAAVKTLAKIGDETAIPELKVALTSKNEKVRYGAAKALGNVGNSSVVPELIVALRDKHPKVRRNAAEALGKVGDASAKGPLEEAAKDLEPEVASAATAALASIQEKIRIEEEKKKAQEMKAKASKGADEKKEKGTLGCGCHIVY